jgi:hypothetical protein
MNLQTLPELDLMPPAFIEGLDDWSCGDGTPDSPTWEGAENARLARGDAHFGTCLEIRLAAGVERLRYMGELPVRAGSFIEIAARVKAVRGPALIARAAAWPGGAMGRAVPGLGHHGPRVALAPHGAVFELRAVVGPESRPGVDLVWDRRALYAHVGVDLEGEAGAVARIEAVAVRDVTRRYAPRGRALPGFEDI